MSMNGVLLVVVCSLIALAGVTGCAEPSWDVAPKDPQAQAPSPPEAVRNSGTVVVQDKPAPAPSAQEAGIARQRELIKAWSAKTPLVFGEPVEQEIVLDWKGRPLFLDLDQNRLVRLPRGYSPNDRRSVHAWAVDKALPISFAKTEQGFELVARVTSYGFSDRRVADTQTQLQYPDLVDDAGRYKLGLDKQWDDRDARRLMQSQFNMRWAFHRSGHVKENDAESDQFESEFKKTYGCVRR